MAHWLCLEIAFFIHLHLLCCSKLFCHAVFGTREDVLFFLLCMFERYLYQKYWTYELKGMQLMEKW